jgi:adenylate cyclase
MQKKASFGDFFKKKLEYIVALVAIVVMVGISLTEAGKRLEYRLYDTLLSMKPEIAARDDVLLVDIDDSAIEQIGAWPWSRDIFADNLIRLKEAGGSSITFDIEFLSPGQEGVNREYVRKILPSEYQQVRSDVLQYVNDFSGAVASKSIPLSFVPEVGTEMAGYIDQSMNGFSESITANIFRDNDAYFAKGLKFFGKAYLTINSAQINTNEEEMAPVIKYAKENILHKNVEDPAGVIPRENLKTLMDNANVKGIAPAILPLLGNSAGAGFPNVVIDEDGIRRRIELLSEFEGTYVAQLVFEPILGSLKPEKIVRKGQTLTLVNATVAGKDGKTAKKNVVIPLDENGRLLINWLKKNFVDEKDPAKGSFTHLSFYQLKYANDLEEKIVDNLASIEALGIKNSNGYLSYHDAVVWLRSSYADLEKWKQELLDGKREDQAEYFAARKTFFGDYGQFFEGGYDTEIYDTFDSVIKETKDQQYVAYLEQIKKNFGIWKAEYLDYIDVMASLSKICAGKFCVIGYSGVGTSDLGVNPFWRHYPNVGTHANIYNTIMSGEFITPEPLWLSWLVAAAIVLLSAFLFNRIVSLRGRILFGVLSVIAVFFGIAGIFVFFRVYIEVLVPLISALISFLLITILKFVFSEQEKSFLRKAFSTYLSADVVDQIVQDPGVLKLGGQEKQITALFTDIKSFSTLSEKVTPEHLVEILNKYLTIMSDIVLAEKGTIDKYIGDAIVSFFGAPLDLPDHATRACMAAVRMKQAETKLNEEMIASGETPMPIYTRIGVNTGAMVVGNMGTDNKMNYTIMGNDVNLAARLEGVNKTYGTWILVSESTWEATNGAFIGRKLDRVRVVGINTPVQLYNVMAVKEEASGKMATLADKFNAAIDAYREKRFGDALLLFTKCSEIDPDDDASKLFLDRVKVLARDGAPADWSDVINMTSK